MRFLVYFGIVTAEALSYLAVLSAGAGFGLDYHRSGKGGRGAIALLLCAGASLKILSETLRALVQS